MIVRLPGREAEDEIPNPVGGPTGVTVFETGLEVVICREVTSSSPVNSPARDSTVLSYSPRTVEEVDPLLAMERLRQPGAAAGSRSSQALAVAGGVETAGGRTVTGHALETRTGQGPSAKPPRFCGSSPTRTRALSASGMATVF